MRAKFTRLLLSIFIAGVMSFSLYQNVYAAYGTGNYGACTYQDQVCPGGSSSSSTGSAGAPDTGQEAISLLWPIVLGILGFSLVSFVVIRYLNRNRALKE